MNAQTDHGRFEASRTTPLAIARNAWLDNFSRLEMAVVRCADRFCGQKLPRGMPLSQRLREISLVAASATCPPEPLKKLQALCRECEPLLPLRATIVHSAMKLARSAGKDAGLFLNGIDLARGIKTRIILTEEDFIRECRTLQSLTDRFNSLLTNPSSPPPPKPAGAAGP